MSEPNFGRLVKRTEVTRSSLTPGGRQKHIRRARSSLDTRNDLFLDAGEPGNLVASEVFLPKVRSFSWFFMMFSVNLC